MLPDVICYDSALSACEKSGLWQHALREVVGSRQEDLMPDVISHNLAISAYEKGGEGPAHRSIVCSDATQ